MPIEISAFYMVKKGGTMNSNEVKNLCGIKEVSNYLDLSESMIRKMVREKTIPFFRIGNRLKFDLIEINNWLDSIKKMESERIWFCKNN